MPQVLSPRSMATKRLAVIWLLGAPPAIAERLNSRQKSSVGLYMRTENTPTLSDTHAFSQPLWYIFLLSCVSAPAQAEDLNCKFSGEIALGAASSYGMFRR